MKLKNKQPLTEIVKVNLKDSKEVELKKIQRVFDEVQEGDIKDFVIDDNDIFDSDEISESDKKLLWISVKELVLLLTRKVLA